MSGQGLEPDAADYRDKGTGVPVLVSDYACALTNQKVANVHTIQYSAVVKVAAHKDKILAVHDNKKTLVFIPAKSRDGSV